MTYLIYFHMGEIKPYMMKTKLFVESLPNDIHVIDVNTDLIDSFEMFNGLMRVWNKGEIIFILGQDNVPSLAVLREMEKCLYHYCSNPCLHYPNSTGFDRIVLNIIDYGVMPSPDFRKEFCEFAGTGFCKISILIQEYTPKPVPFHYQAFDKGIWELSYRCKDVLRHHLHYPLHEHTKGELLGIEAKI